MQEIAACCVLFLDLTLTPDRHYENVISIEKFRSDSVLREFGPGRNKHGRIDWFSKWLDSGHSGRPFIRKVNAFYRLVFLKL